MLEKQGALLFSRSGKSEKTTLEFIVYELARTNKLWLI